MSQQLSAPRLTVRLGAVARNYQLIAERAGEAETGAAVKADAYGLGVPQVAQALWDAGCREFFVASVGEGIEVRSQLRDATVNVFNGAMPGTLDALIEHDLVPLLISAEQIAEWSTYAARLDRCLPAGLHFDTGMNRTGITTSEAEALAADRSVLDAFEIRHVLSHMACADDPASKQPEEQLARYRALRAQFAEGKSSLANSAGVFRDPAFHFDLVRPGIAIYGGAPLEGVPNPMEHTVVLEAPILQIKDMSPGDLVGYGATHEVVADTRHAVVPVGYADGFLRSASNSGELIVAGQRCPIVGRVSMDLIIIDVGHIPAVDLALGMPVEILGQTRTIDDVAAATGTIANEIITGLWSRYERVYSTD